MLWLELILTAITVTLILRLNDWIVKNRKKHPELHRQRPAMFMVLQFLLSVRDLF